MDMTVKHRNTNLHLEAENGKWYLYDITESGHSICYGVYDCEGEAKHALKQYMALEKKGHTEKPTANSVMDGLMGMKPMREVA